MRNTIKVNERYYDKVIKILDLMSAINAAGTHYTELKVITENNILAIINFFKDKSFAYFDIDFERNNCEELIEKCLILLEDLEYDIKYKIKKR